MPTNFAPTSWVRNRDGLDPRLIDTDDLRWDRSPEA